MKNSKTCKLCAIGTFIVMGIFGIVHFSILFLDDISFEKYSVYQEHLLTGVGLMFGLLGIVTMYYLSKYHDYSKELVKVKGNFIEFSLKLKLLLKQIPISEYTETRKTISEYEGVLSEQKLLSQDILRRVLMTNFLISAMYGYSLVQFFVNYDSSTLNAMIIVLNSLFAGLALFFISWRLFEELLTRSVNILDSNHSTIAELMFTIYELENRKQHN